MILVYLCLAILFCVTNGVSVNNSLIIKNITKFPISINQPFEVIITPVNEKVQFGFSFSGPIVIQIIDEIGIDIEVAVLEFDLKDPSERDFKGDFIRIHSWERNTEKRTINLTLSFTKRSFNQSIEIYHINASSMKERRNMLNDLKLAENLYRSKIVIVDSPKIDLYLIYDENRAIEYDAHKMYTIVCQSLDESSKTEPYFVFENNSRSISYNPIYLHYNKTDNSKRFNVDLKPSHHLTNISCRTNDSSQTIQIKVLHRPSRVYINNTNDKIVEKGSNVICKAQDGYPEPKVEWSFISGPNNASSFYKISEDKRILYFSVDIPTESYWTFRCNSTNKIRGVEETYFQIESFTIRNENNVINITDEILRIKRTLNRYGHLLTRLDGFYSLGKLKLLQQNMRIVLLEDSVEKLRKDNREQKKENTELRSVLKNVEKSLKHFLKTYVRLNKTTPKMMVTSAPKRGPDVVLPWEVGDIYKLRKKRKFLTSQKFYNNRIKFPLRLWLSFKEFDVLRVTLHMSQLYYVRPDYVTRGVVTMTIANLDNRAANISMTKHFQRNRHPINLEFPFMYYELNRMRIFSSDEIIILCSVTIF